MSAQRGRGTSVLVKTKQEVEEALEAMAMAFADWKAPTIPEDMSCFQIATDYAQLLQVKLTDYSNGNILLKKDPPEEEWERGLKEPGMRCTLISKDRKQKQRIWFPPNLNTVYMSQVYDNTQPGLQLSRTDSNSGPILTESPSKGSGGGFLKRITS